MGCCSAVFPTCLAEWCCKLFWYFYYLFHRGPRTSGRLAKRYHALLSFVQHRFANTLFTAPDPLVGLGMAVVFGLWPGHSRLVFSIIYRQALLDPLLVGFKAAYAHGRPLFRCLVSLVRYRYGTATSYRFHRFRFFHVGVVNRPRAGSHQSWRVSR